MRFAYAPGPLVHHDNWMTEAEFERLMRGSLLGGTAVFTKFALSASAPALDYLLRIGVRVLGDRMGAGSVVEGAWRYAVGFAAGFAYRFIAPPKLAPPTGAD